MIIEKSKITFSNLTALIICLFLIFAHRVGYAPLIPILFIYFFKKTGEKGYSNDQSKLYHGQRN